MAFVKSIERSKRRSLRLQPTQVSCQYTVDRVDSGSKVFQLDSLGSSSRQELGQVSQTLQFDEKQARELWNVLGREFGFA